MGDIDFAKAWKIVAKIRKYPEMYEQATWVSNALGYVAADVKNTSVKPECGTQACFAGWGGFLFAPKGTYINGSGQMSIMNGKTERRVHVSDFVRDELGLTDAQANIIYYCDSLNEIEAILEALEENSELNEFDLIHIRNEASDNDHYDDDEDDPDWY